MIIILVRLFYVSVFYFPTKKLAEQYEWSDRVVHSNDVLQCICSTIVEENPALTVYDVVDPSKTICADFNQGNTRTFRQNTGKQCVTTSLIAIIPK